MDASPFATFLAFCEQHKIPVSPDVALVAVPGMGNGMVAVQPIPAHTELFSVPKTSILSTQMCELKDKLLESEWEGLNGGWGRLILCLMWEEGRGEASPWRGYLDILPKTFSTPMFWSGEEIAELKGTSIHDKIGAEEATTEYTNRLLPIIRAHPELFPADKFDEYFSEKSFHIQGSRILSRSFKIEGTHDAEQEDDGLEEDEEEDDGGEDVDKVGMVPMADMLNARWGEENSRLFFTETHLSMITTRDIPAGAQVYNTYAQPPNADLLRRYGHVDVIPPSRVGNEEDEVEIRCDVFVAVVQKMLVAKGLWGDGKEWDMEGRVEFWLEEGGDDTIPIQITDPLPPPLVAFLTLLLLSPVSYLTAKEKGKLPRPKHSLEGIEAGKVVLRRRLLDYTTSLEDDLELLALPPTALGERKHAAIIVRAGEKNVLAETIRLLEKEESKLVAAGGSNSSEGKRKAGVRPDRAGGKKKMR